MNEPVTKLRGEHCINVFVSYELKERVAHLAKRYDRTMADIVRTLIRLGIPVMEGLSKAEERMLKDYIYLIRRMKKIKKMGIEEDIDKIKTELESE